jgi:hypothetical protein
MSKPDENDKQPDPPKLFKGLPLPDNCRDVTAERIGEKFALVLGTQKTLLIERLLCFCWGAPNTKPTRE